MASRAGTKLPIWAMSVNEGDLADVSAFAGHVGTGDQQDQAIVGGCRRVVGDERAVGQQRVEDGVAAVMDG